MINEKSPAGGFFVAISYIAFKIWLFVIKCLTESMRFIKALSLALCMLFAKTALAATCDFPENTAEGAVGAAITEYQNAVRNLITTSGVSPDLANNACSTAKTNISKAGDVVAAQNKAKDAREKELSKENRALTAATMAATSAGMMQLMQGKAELKADQAGADAMEAYLATIRCGIGNNRDVKLNETGTTPGRGTEFGDAVMDAVTLAQKISNAKKHLDKQPGMEDDFLNLIDTSTLYTGRGSDTEARKNRFDTAQERLDSNSAQNKMVAGGALAGAGVLGGVVGNQVINNNAAGGIKSAGGVAAIAGAAAGGGGLGAIAGGLGSGGGIGAVGTAASSLMGKFSDRRLKENLTPIGKLDNGLTIYSGNYRADTGLDTRPQIFLIADEVIMVNPGAVTENENGYLMVDYDKATK